MSSNSVKITYIICVTINQIFLLCLAVFSPIYITPGYYWWTAFFLVLLSNSSILSSKRLNSWGDLGNNT